MHTGELPGVSVGEQHRSYVPYGRAKGRRVAVYEKSSEFKDGQRFRAGIERRISVLFRGRREGFELWIAPALLANNLMKIASLSTRRSSRKREAA
jgi:transposase, IS5 family